MSSIFNKYEPKNLDELLANENNKTILKGFLKQKEIPQSYVFVGDRGCGKSLTALLLAKELNCQNNIMQLDCITDRSIENSNAGPLQNHSLLPVFQILRYEHVDARCIPGFDTGDIDRITIHKGAAQMVAFSEGRCCPASFVVYEAKIGMVHFVGPVTFANVFEAVELTVKYNR